MKKNFTFLLCLFLILQVKAQIFQITGKIVSNENNTIEFADVFLLQNNFEKFLMFLLKMIFHDLT